ncbi:MAG TPA: hypothetical protein VFE61_15150 [Candidatus Sulfotelmatobacter sp.]|nr:hypothetical protein [Candidatus Sulfotelmatobacter sp.]
MPAYYIVLQQKIPGVDDIGLEGRALSKHNQKLEALAQEGGVTPLAHFFSVDPEEAAGLLGDHASEVDIPEETWFPAEDGLKTIAALLKTLVGAPPVERSALVGELKQFQQVLEAARSRDIRWHLGIDY